MAKEDCENEGKMNTAWVEKNCGCERRVEGGSRASGCGVRGLVKGLFMESKLI